MFQFPAFASYPYVFRIRYLYRHLETKTADDLSPTAQIFQVSKVGFPIRKSTDQRVFAPPRSLSQRITSFIACACQGIHQSPLRHLIILIANAHRTCVQQYWQKRPASRDLSGGLRLGEPIICRRLSVSGDDAASINTRPPTKGYGPFRTGFRMRNPNKSSLHDVIQNRRPAVPAANFISHGCPSPSANAKRWWSRTGSNRRPPACKAGALPAELRPLTLLTRNGNGGPG